jgi:hypothetical protein
MVKWLKWMGSKGNAQEVKKQRSREAEKAGVYLEGQLRMTEAQRYDGGMEMETWRWRHGDGLGG